MRCSPSRAGSIRARRSPSRCRLRSPSVLAGRSAPRARSSSPVGRWARCSARCSPSRRRSARSCSPVGRLPAWPRRSARRWRPWCWSSSCCCSSSRPGRSCRWSCRLRSPPASTRRSSGPGRCSRYRPTTTTGSASSRTSRCSACAAACSRSSSPAACSSSSAPTGGSRSSEFWHPIIGAFGFAIIGLAEPRALGVGYDVIDDVLRRSARRRRARRDSRWPSCWPGGWPSARERRAGRWRPCCSISGAFGSLFGTAVQHVAPGAHIAPGAFALVAMAATFGAAVGASFAAIVFLFELTRDYQIILPLMLATVIADVVARSLMRDDLMTEKLTRRGVHVESDYTVDALAGVTVGDVMTTSVHTLGHRRHHGGGATAHPTRWPRRLPDRRHGQRLRRRSSPAKTCSSSTRPATATQRSTTPTPTSSPSRPTHRSRPPCDCSSRRRSATCRSSTTASSSGCAHAPTSCGRDTDASPTRTANRDGDSRNPDRTDALDGRPASDPTDREVTCSTTSSSGTRPWAARSSPTRSPTASGADRASFYVLVPATRQHDLYGSVLNALEGTPVTEQETIDAAEQRLADSLKWIRDRGGTADGAVGDPNPLTAISHVLVDSSTSTRSSCRPSPLTSRNGSTSTCPRASPTPSTFPVVHVAASADVEAEHDRERR